MKSDNWTEVYYTKEQEIGSRRRQWGRRCPICSQTGGHSYDCIHCTKADLLRLMMEAREAEAKARESHLRSWQMIQIIQGKLQIVKNENNKLRKANEKLRKEK